MEEGGEEGGRGEGRTCKISNEPRNEVKTLEGGKKTEEREDRKR